MHEPRTLAVGFGESGEQVFERTLYARTALHGEAGGFVEDKDGGVFVDEERAGVVAELIYSNIFHRDRAGLNSTQRHWQQWRLPIVATFTARGSDDKRIKERYGARPAVLPDCVRPDAPFQHFYGSP
jgi:hypothetical protein